MKACVFVIVLLISILGCENHKNEKYKARPNILLIVSEDHGQHLSCYNDSIINTPNLDKIADEGILFKNAYVTESVCSPSRSSILTGLYPHQNGQLGLATHGYHLVGKIDNIYSLLKVEGYRTGMIGKLHINPSSDFPIDYHPIKEGNFEKLDLNRYWNTAKTFMKTSEAPFFLMLNFPDAHWPLQNKVQGSPKYTMTPDEVVSFPYIGYENERIRGVTANYYNSLLRLDECVGNVMNALDESGKRNNTIVIYLSDHGDQMTRGKFDVYEAGTKVPFLVNWPGRIQAGSTSEALISSVDIVPTILDVVGSHIPENVAGKSLVSLFENPNTNFRDYLFTEKNCDNKSTYFPRRAVRDKRYKLIYSFLNDRVNPAAEIYLEHPKHQKPEYVGGPTLDELKDVPVGVKETYYSWLRPPKLQLFDLENDPWEFNDIADDPKYSREKENLLNALYA